MDAQGKKTLTDAVCTRCGCACDDIVLVVEGNRILHAENACELGREWFLSPPEGARPVCAIEGHPASFQEGIKRAARILSESRYPLVYGLNDTTCEAQRQAAAIADRIGGVVDTGVRSGADHSSWECRPWVR